MKKLFISIILMIFLAIPMAVLASSDVTFRWDPNAEADLAGYKLYQSDVSVSMLDANNDGHITLEELKAGSHLQVADIPAGTETVTIQVEDGTWYWVLTAYDTGNSFVPEGNESGPSNEVTATLDTEAPAPPKNLLITLIKKIIAFLKSLFGFGEFRAIV